MATWANRIVGYLFRPYRRHKWMLLVCLVVTLFYATMSIQGDSSPEYAFAALPVCFEHGWPMEYMKREQLIETWGKRWRIYSGINSFEYTPLFLNIAFAIGLSLLFTYLWHIHRTRCKPWQFTLKELLLVMLVLSVALGAYAKLRHDYTLEDTYLSQVEEIGWLHFFTWHNPPWYLQPFCDLAIINKENGPIKVFNGNLRTTRTKIWILIE